MPSEADARASRTDDKSSLAPATPAATPAFAPSTSPFTDFAASRAADEAASLAADANCSLTLRSSAVAPESVTFVATALCFSFA